MKDKKFIFENHIVVIEWTDFAKLIITQLINAHNKVVILTKSVEQSEVIKNFYKDEPNVYIAFLDYENIENLEYINIEKSAMAFINLCSDTEKLVYILNAQKRYPQMNFVVTLDNPNLKDTFRAAGVTYTLSKNEIASKMAASYIFEPDVAEFAEDLLATASSDQDYDIKEYKITGENPFVNYKYIDVYFQMREKYHSILIGLSKIENNQRMVYKNPPDNMLIRENDYLIIITNGSNSTIISQDFKIDEGVFN